MTSFSSLLHLWQNPKLILSLFLLSLISSLYISLTYLDPDFGWHIATGQYESQHFIPDHTLFNYTMPSYPYVDHEWLTNIAMYQIYQIGGYPILAIISTLIIGLIIILIYQSSKQLKLLAPLLVFASLISQIGIRPQILSWLYTAILIQVLMSRKYLYSLPLLFILWANTHGSYAFGLIIVIAYLLYQWHSRQLSQLTTIFLIIISILSTFITPYFGRNWWEIYQTMRDTHLSTNIAEWQPFWKQPNLTFIFTSSLLILLIYYLYPSKLIRIATITLIIFASSAIRHAPLFTIITTPWITRLLIQFSQKINKFPHAKQRFQFSYYLLCTIALIIILIETPFVFLQTNNMSETNFYPQSASTHLTQLPHGRLFSSYSWGGYLIGQNHYPLFIDGRMPSYHWQAPKGELNNAFIAYSAITNGDQVEPYFHQFNIQTVLWPQPHKTLWQKNPPQSQFIHQLKPLGFELVYSDNISLIYHKKDPWN